MIRLRQLNLVRYGHFTDFTLDFGDYTKNRPDFHIIFGDNEAGKSTAFNGYLDLLFGIEERSKYSFLHDYNVLRVGAVLETDKGTFKLSRIKRRDANLLGVNDLPVDKELLTSALHGLSREAYQTLFSLNDETLELGGEEILASKGDLGRLLFAGAAGVTNLSKEIELLLERANKVYTEGSRTDEISSLKQELKQLDEERQCLDIQTNSYVHLIEMHRKAEDAYLCARKDRDDIRCEQTSLKMLKDAFATRDDLLELKKKLAFVHHLPDVPPGWIGEVKELQLKVAAEEERRDDALIDINCTNKQLEDLTTDPMIVKVKEELSTIATVAAHNQAACNDLPKLKDELLEVDAELEVIRQKLDAETIIQLADRAISDDTIADLDKLSQKETQLLDRLNTARQEASDAKENFQLAQEEEKAAALPDRKVMELVALSDGYIEINAQQRLEQAEKTLCEQGRKIERELKKLTPWTGNQDDIRSKSFPTSAQANRWKERTNRLEKERDNQRTRQTELKERQATNDSIVKTLLGQGNAITDTNAAQSRRARDDAWTMHRKRLDSETADAFEKVLVEDDYIRDERLIAADRLSQIRIAEIELAKTDSKLKVLAEEINRIDSGFQGLCDEMRPVLAKAGLPENFQAEKLSEWLDCLQQVRNLIEQEDECRAERDQAKCDYDRRRSMLLKALTKVGAKPLKSLDLKELYAISKQYQNKAIKDENQRAVAQKAVLTAESQMRRRDKALKDAEDEFKKWQENWRKVLEGLWFEQKSVSQIQALLEPFRKLAPLLTRQRTLIETISAKENDCHKFRESVSKLVRSLGLEEKDDVATQFSSLQTRLKNAQQAEAAYNATVVSRTQAEKRLEKAETELLRIEKRVKEMSEHLSQTAEIIKLDQLALLLDRAKQKIELINAVSEKERDLLKRLRVETQADAEMKLDAKTPPAVEASLAKIDGDLKEAEEELEKRIGERRDALRAIEAISDDSSVARLNEKRRSILFEISSKADRVLPLHLGWMTANRALAEYRDRHCSELLMRTGDAFKAITAGEFSRLTTQPGQAGDRLIAVRSNGRSIAAKEMSKGTRFQLYLALRLAAYHRFCNMKGSLPFIGDDIMETFDDHRTKSAICQLSEIAKGGQVLYFTHHRHLCEIAKDVCGADVMIHEIPKQY